MTKKTHLHTDRRPCHPPARSGRREFIRTTGLGLLALASVPALLPSVRAQSGGLQVRTINPALHIISGAGCNVLVRENAGEVMVVDGGLTARAGDLLDTIGELTGNGDITRLVNTHWHEQQTGLNVILGQRGVPILAHENTRQWLNVKIERPWEDRVYPPLPVAARPSETFYHYGDFDHAGVPVQYGYLRQAHTDGDMYIFLPEDNILHGGGVLANDSWPELDWWTGGWLGGLADGLDVLLQVANPQTVIIPANGPLMSYADLREMRDMYDLIFRRISGMFRAANSVEDTLAEMPTAEFNARYGDPEQFIRLAHDSLKPHFTPDA